MLLRMLIKIIMIGWPWELRPSKGIKFMGWLQSHFATFVSGALGADISPKLPENYIRFFSPEEMSVIKNMWRSVKHVSVTKGKPVLLAGRDVFVFEVLARREGFPTTFRPDISRLTVPHVKENYKDHFLFDTGFMGSIPIGLGMTDYVMASATRPSMLGSHFIDYVLPAKNDSKQVFPRMRGSRSLALHIEASPKYWQRGYTRDNGIIHQDLSDQATIVQAAYLTIEVYTDSSPKFQEKLSLVSGKRSGKYLSFMD